MRVAVIGHIEWAKFAHVGHVPAPGEIIHTLGTWEEVAGGGAVAAMQLAKMADECVFFTAIGDDWAGNKAVQQLTENKVTVYATKHQNVPTKEIFVYIDTRKERTITVTGNLKPSGADKSLPWEKLSEMDAIFFVSGDELALRAARASNVLVSTARILPLLEVSNIKLDAIVSSQKDSSEKYRTGAVNPTPSLIVRTNGVAGGMTGDGISYSAIIVPTNKLLDTYGCGDSFAAGLTFGLGKGLPVLESLTLAARCGAEAAQRRGAFGNGQFLTD